MTRFDKGDNVVSKKEIGGVIRDHVPAGTPGVVIEAGWGARARVRFKVSGGSFSGDRAVDVDVDDNDDEIL